MKFFFAEAEKDAVAADRERSANQHPVGSEKTVFLVFAHGGKLIFESEFAILLARSVEKTAQIQSGKRVEAFQFADIGRRVFDFDAFVFQVVIF